jgi:hypothetical protein
MSNRVYYLENTNPNPKSKSGYYNKFYRMIELDNGKFLAEWGSIGKNPLGTKEYSMNEWHEIQTKKESKGYIFGNDPGNTTLLPQPIQSPQPVEPKHDMKKVSDVKLKIRMVVELLAQKENGALYERVQEIYGDFCNDPGTFTPDNVKELNEIYNKFRVEKD